MKINALSDLKQVKKAIEAQAAREAALAAHKAAEAKRKAAASNLFQAAIGKVKPLEPPQRAKLTPEPPKPIPKQQMLDDAAALQEALSDEIDVTTLLDTDEHLSFRRPGVGTDVTQKLRKGKWSIQKQIDLHGYRSDEAREALGAFIRESHRNGIRCVRVVHGKGLGSPGKAPVLKEKVHKWLVQKAEVVAFVQAQPAQGGAGALVVLLQPQNRA
ncbi:endonuclease MutS2 [Comamonadaceae bacterium OS-4]|jgi:DNA-nicking Smr family endonuclease|uniref:Smr/MutS family protein n=1 Tax=Rhodoferax potami TaxID=3068338 RepID=A0ABU3KQB7_9BURK|nr:MULTISPECIES: Smr/MutS family protein [unclassified Rhodoferax]MDT7519788.1 Smr/MutS family protein [Rhodoferax sp. TBRC 17660]MDT7522844.1 Smr/MutS family protein [Rhodoferax sp. TBRC 17198]BDT73136.1 endonuclease MutS2 [Comamonadaceae bacterium OS-4]